MAIAIKSVPTLTGKVAQNFVEKADKAFEKRGTIDCSEQMKITHAILKKAGMR